jgi:hypothetical protein
MREGWNARSFAQTVFGELAVVPHPPADASFCHALKIATWAFHGIPAPAIRAKSLGFGAVAWQGSAPCKNLRLP